MRFKQSLYSETIDYIFSFLAGDKREVQKNQRSTAYTPEEGKKKSQSCLQFHILPCKNFLAFVWKSQSLSVWKNGNGTCFIMLKTQGF